MILYYLFCRFWFFRCRERCRSSKCDNGTNVWYESGCAYTYSTLVSSKKLPVNDLKMPNSNGLYVAHMRKFEWLSERACARRINWIDVLVQRHRTCFCMSARRRRCIVLIQSYRHSTVRQVKNSLISRHRNIIRSVCIRSRTHRLGVIRSINGSLSCCP